MEKFFDRSAGYGLLIKSVANKKDPSKIYYVIESGRINEIGKYYPDWAFKAIWDNSKGGSVPAAKAFSVQIFLGDLGQARKVIKEMLDELSIGQDLVDKPEPTPF